MRKAWEVVAIVIALSVLFWPSVQRALPGTLWTVLLVAILCYGISLTFGPGISPRRRLGAAYLVLIALAYVLGGALGLLRNGGLIEASMWQHLLVSPYVLISFLEQLVHHFPYTAGRAPYGTLPSSEHRLYSALVVIVGALGIVAAFALARDRRLARSIWLVLLGVAGVSLLGYLLVGAISWGLREAIVPLCWVMSYFAAFLMVSRGQEPRKAGSS